MSRLQGACTGLWEVEDGQGGCGGLQAEAETRPLGCWKPKWAGPGPGRGWGPGDTQLQELSDSCQNPRAPGLASATCHLQPHPALGWHRTRMQGTFQEEGQEAELTSWVRFLLAPPGGAPCKQHFLSPWPFPGCIPGAPAGRVPTLWPCVLEQSLVKRGAMKISRDSLAPSGCSTNSNYCYCCCCCLWILEASTLPV